MFPAAPFMHAPLPDQARQPGIVLDLETRLDDGTPWCFGWQMPDGCFHICVVDRCYEGQPIPFGDCEIEIVPDEMTGWELFAEAAAAWPGPVHHWGSFEKGVLRKTAPESVIAALDERLYDLNAALRRSILLPFKGTGLKKVAVYLGFRWPEYDSALRCWADYQGWLLDADDDALRRACAYNRADVEATVLVWRWMNVLERL